MKKIKEELRNELGIFYKKLGHLIGSGIPLLWSLKSITEEMEGSGIGKIIPQIKDDIEKGKTLSKSMSQYPEVFSPSVMNMIQAGEQCGALDTYSLKLAEWFEKGESTVIYVPDKPKGDQAEVPKEIESTEVAELANSIISEAASKRASDIHIIPEKERVKVRFRIDGVLHDIKDLDKEKGEAFISRLKLMAGGMDVFEKKLPQDGRIKVKVQERNLDLRVSTLPAIFGEKMTLRILDKSTMLLRLDQIADAEELPLLEKFTEMPYGLVLVTGPTGCGKTTFLYALVKEFKKKVGINVTAIEDPVEYLLEGVTQIPIKPNIGLTFARALRSVLRSDPDVVVVGEIRDYETAAIIMQTVITGHAVLSTLHTPDALSAVKRMKDMGIEPFLLSDTLEGIVAMRLVRLFCPKCKEEYTATEKESQQLGLDTSQKISVYWPNPKGCPDCSMGYRGRAALFEIFIPDGEIKNAISSGRDLSLIREEAIKKGALITFRQAGIKKILNGLTSVEEVLSVLRAR